MTRDELLAAYAAGKRNFRGAYLGGADLAGAYLGGAYLRGADLAGADLAGADLRWAYLGGADLAGAYLGGADLGGAHFRGADLRGAYLRGAYLRGAHLGGAYFRGAYLRGADLGDQWVIQGSTRSDGHPFMLSHLTNEPVLVKAGCRSLEPSEAVEHWTKTRGGTPLGDESLAIIAHMLELQRIRGLK